MDGYDIMPTALPKDGIFEPGRLDVVAGTHELPAYRTVRLVMGLRLVNGSALAISFEAVVGFVMAYRLGKHLQILR